MLVAQVTAEGVTLLTLDPMVAKYPWPNPRSLSARVEDKPVITHYLTDELGSRGQGGPPALREVLLFALRDAPSQWLVWHSSQTIRVSAQLGSSRRRWLVSTGLLLARSNFQIARDASTAEITERVARTSPMPHRQ